MLLIFGSFFHVSFYIVKISSTRLFRIFNCKDLLSEHCGAHSFSCVCAFLFSAIIIYDMQLITYKLFPEEYVVGVINLYLDIINLFLEILKNLDDVNKRN
jgi:FtsH-binding integral membrane protein